MPVGAGRGRSGPVGAGAGAGRPRCRPVPTGAGAAERPQETLYALKYGKLRCRVKRFNEKKIQ